MELKAKEVLVALAAKNGGDWSKMYKSIKDGIKPTVKEIERFSPLAEQAVVILDEDYPNTWKNAYRPPMVLFYKGGERSLLGKIGIFSISVLDDGKDHQTKKIIDDILEHGGLIAIPELDSGDIIIKNKTQSLTLSEYPDGAYDANSKEQRARVIDISASLCGKLFIGIVKNTVANTAACSAVGSGKDVYVVPTSLGTSYANNEFIRDGAYVALDWKDVMSERKEEDENADN